MILVVAADHADDLMALLAEHGEDVTRIGHVTDAPGMQYKGQLL